MKLTNTQITQVKDQLSAEPVPDDSPAADLLKQHFGDHTFYVDELGLHIFESYSSEEDKSGDTCEILPVRVASWTDEKREALTSHDPIVGSTGAVVDVKE